jgi:hypothetical protein
MTPEEIAAKAAADALAAELAAKQPPAQKTLEELVAEGIAAGLADVKEKLNSAYGARDLALQQAALAEKTANDLKIARLTAEGNHAAAFELQMAEANAKIAVITRQNTELGRDNAVREEMRGLSFRNTKAASLAFQEVVGSLVQNDAGQWIHSSGVPIATAVAAFAADPEQSFLFQTKPNSGNGQQQLIPPTITQNTSVFAMSQADVLAKAAKAVGGA